MARSDFSDWNCSVARAMGVVGDRWTMLVLREAFFGVRRFDEIQANLGIARNVLADRLARLVEHEILARRIYQERPERFEYRLTDKGLGLYAPLVALMKWGDEHMADAAGPPVVLEHLTCAHATTPTLTCSHCGEPLHAREVRPAPGPGAIPAGRTARAAR